MPAPRSVVTGTRPADAHDTHTFVLFAVGTCPDDDDAIDAGVCGLPPNPADAHVMQLAAS